MKGPVILWVGAGAALGSWLRVGVALGMPAVEFPLATLTVNVAGSFLIGLVAALTAPEGRLFVSGAARQFVMAGFCGGMTTFSIFSLEAMEQLLAGAPLLFGVHVLVSLAGWLCAVWLGYAFGMKLNGMKS